MHSSARHRLPDEVRAMWVVRTSMVSPQAIERAVALAARYGFNALFAQVRGRGDAYYRSRYEPRAEPLASQPADFDPLGLPIALRVRRRAAGACVAECVLCVEPAAAAAQPPACD
jgi:uncharacterized lipoprotein YddW (UPF0748 family)